MATAAILKHVAFAVLLALFSAGVVRTMIAVRLMDTPDARKSHTRPTPKGGGVGIVLAFLIGLAALYRFAEFARLADPYFKGVILTSVAISIVAFLDDLYDWPFFAKLGIQVLAAVVAVSTGLYLHEYRVPGLGEVTVGLVGIPLTMLWLLFATNAMNFIDGLNGLASGTVLIACLFLGGIAAFHGAWFVYGACGLLAAGIAGFLPFNYPHARIFMGDVGSQFCGFMLAVLAVVAGRIEGVTLSFLLVPMLVSGVLYDVAFTLVRRWKDGERVTQAHRGHLYQVAQRCGTPAPMVAAIHWGFTVFGGLCCLLFLVAPWPAKALVPFLTLVPQAIWTRHVIGLARRNGLARWG